MVEEIQTSQGTRPVNQNILSMWWTRTSRLSKENSLSGWQGNHELDDIAEYVIHVPKVGTKTSPAPPNQGN